jgi:hypothetical protein
MADLVMKGPMVHYFLGKPSPYEPIKVEFHY